MDCFPDFFFQNLHDHPERFSTSACAKHRLESVIVQLPGFDPPHPETLMGGRGFRGVCLLTSPGAAAATGARGTPGVPSTSLCFMVREVEAKEMGAGLAIAWAGPGMGGSTLEHPLPLLPLCLGILQEEAALTHLRGPPSLECSATRAGRSLVRTRAQCRRPCGPGVRAT